MKQEKEKSDRAKNVGKSSRFVQTLLPKRHEGVGRALLSAYPAGQNGSVPGDMMALLQQLGCSDKS
ncbi:MAG: hypothetical protein R3E04_02065 [Sphingobium sp.]